MKKVFINYSWEHDSDKAAELYNRLSDANAFDVWLDKKRLKGGLKWRPAVRKAIRNANFFISILSTNSIQGRGTRNKEIYEALDVLDEFPPGQVFLIPTRLDECHPPFDKMEDLHWVDMFPNFDEGYKSLLSALGVSDPGRILVQEVVQEEESASYEYRIGIVDLDLGLVNLSQVASQLNNIQSYFLFTNPPMPQLNIEPITIEGITNFPVFEVPETYITEHRHLAVDFMACITKLPLAFEEGDRVLYNYFSGASDQDERFLFLSTDQLYEFCREAGRTFEEGLVYILVGQLIVYFTKTGYHNETSGCVMDFCENRHDLVQGLKKRSVCEDCLQTLTNEEFKDAVTKLLNWRYKRNAQ